MLSRDKVNKHIIWCYYYVELKEAGNSKFKFLISRFLDFLDFSIFSIFSILSVFSVFSFPSSPLCLPTTLRQHENNILHLSAIHIFVCFVAH